eukprot:6584809-Pyramimonas_sp.AAC.1
MWVRHRRGFCDKETRICSTFGGCDIDFGLHMMLTSPVDTGADGPGHTQADAATKWTCEGDRFRRLFCML